MVVRDRHEMETKSDRCSVIEDPGSGNARTVATGDRQSMEISPRAGQRSQGIDVNHPLARPLLHDRRGRTRTDVYVAHLADRVVVEYVEVAACVRIVRARLIQYVCLIWCQDNQVLGYR